MHAASLATVLSVLATGARAARMAQHLPGWPRAHGGSTPLPLAHGLHCPEECLECCMAENDFFLFESSRQDKSKFKCILDEDNMANAANVSYGQNPRACDKPTPRASIPGQWKMTCSLTTDEKQRGVAETLTRCPFKKLVKSYSDFLAGQCNVALPDNAWLGPTGGVIGQAIGKMYFTVRSPLTGGVCGLKGSEFRDAGLFDKLCASDCQEGRESERCGACLDQAQEDMCALLDSDLKAGRLDLFSLAAWAGAVGKLPQVEKFPVPSSSPRSYRKVEIPGWPERTAAIGTEAEDWPIDLKGGAFMCMMSKLQSLPLNDDLDTPHANQYINELTEVGLGSQSALSPRNAEEVLSAYLDRFGIYQSPLHFDVPKEEILTDRTLERMVFEAIGAHRLELLRGDGQVEGLNLVVPVLPPAGGTGPMLDSLPEHLRGQARFALRMEGLFEDLPLRKHMAGWGGNAIFSAAGKLLALQYRGETLAAEEAGGPRGADSRRRWEYLKFVFRSSLVSTITSFDHLVCTHILVSETLALATKETLPPLHPLRLLLSPHNYKAGDINFKATNNLFPRNMLVHRASPWDDGAFSPEEQGDFGKLWKKVSILKYRTFPELFETYRNFRAQVPEMPELPFYEDGLLFYGALRAHIHRFMLAHVSSEDEDVKRFVSRFFELGDPATDGFWPEDLKTASSNSTVLEDLLTECLFVITGWHRHVGTVPDFFRDTRLAATAWKEGEAEPRPKHAMLMMLLAATTNAMLPQMGGNMTSIFKDWAGIPDVPDWARLSQDMAEVQEKIAERNEHRKSADRLQFHQMEPQYVEWGVMV